MYVVYFIILENSRKIEKYSWKIEDFQNYQVKRILLRPVYNDCSSECGVLSRQLPSSAGYPSLRQRIPTFQI